MKMKMKVKVIKMFSIIFHHQWRFSAIRFKMNENVKWKWKWEWVDESGSALDVHT